MDSTNLRITQINLQHCKEASSVLNHHLHKMQTDLALVREPWIYKKVIKGLNIRRGRIFCDTNIEKPRSCIVTGPKVQARMLGHLTSRDVTAIQIDMVFDGKEREVVFSSVYLPYDSTDLPPSKEMVSLINYCSHNNYPLIIGCDTNSHYLCWVSTGNNNRGDALLEYLATTDLIFPIRAINLHLSNW